MTELRIPMNFLVLWAFKEKPLTNKKFNWLWNKKRPHFIITCDNAIVGRFQNGSIELNNIFVAQDTQNLSLDEVKEKNKQMQRWKSQTAVKHSGSNECCVNVIKLFFHYSMSRSNITLEMCVNMEPLAVLWDMSAGTQTEWLQPGKLLNSSKQWNRLCQCCWVCINTDSNTHRLQTHIKMLHFTLTVYQICFRQR